MESEKRLTLVVLVITGLVALLCILDMVTGIPFGQRFLLDVMFVLAAGFLIWQGVETYLEYS